MNTLLLGNCISLIGCLVMVTVGFLKKKSQILIAQCFQCTFIGFANLILGGISGFTCMMISLVRNLIFLKHTPSILLKLCFITLQILFSLAGLSNGLINFLPIIGASLYTWNLDTTNIVRLKVVIIITMILWLIYDLHFHNYVSSAFDIMSICSNIIGLFMLRKRK